MCRNMQSPQGPETIKVGITGAKLNRSEQREKRVVFKQKQRKSKPSCDLHGSFLVA